MSQSLDTDFTLHLHEDRDESVRGQSFAAARSLKRALLDELRAGQEEGSPRQPEELLMRWPGDPRKDPDVASLLFEDFQQRQRQGDDPSIEEYEERFPEHKDSLADVFRHHAVMRSLGGMSGSTVRLALPAVGDELFGFRLCHELGRGAFARVFLAEQADLAGRPVVLKVSAIEGDEPQTLAQLQHTNIVPIYSVHEDAQAGLRAVCMPYFGGASLSRVLESLWEKTDSPTRGGQLVQALEAVSSPAAKTTDNGPLSLLGGFTYVRAVAWIVARLAEALQHAHQRGVLHRDIKPSNILLGADGEPMLLDFNLAQNQHGDQAQAEATLGGTVAYMAPEHLRALAARDPALARLVDRRADIYSLGMVLYEMLVGQRPFDQSGSYTPLPALIEAMALERGKTAPSLRQRRADVPWSLESILRKCMAPDATRRYQQAEHLAEDLRRWLEDLPLKHAPELSRTERLRKWLRRHPRLTSSGTVAAAAGLLLVAGAAAFVGVQNHLTKAREQIAVDEAQKRKRDFETGTQRALCLVNTNSDLHDRIGGPRSAPQDHLRQGMNVCEETLALYDVLDGDDWQEHPAWQRLDEDERQRLAEEVRELLMLLAWARVRTAPEDREVLRQALHLLDRAENIQGLKPSPALWMDRATYLEQLGDKEGARAAREKADQTPPVSVRDHYLIAGVYTRQGRHAEALTLLNHALRLNPKHYWSWLQRGICHHDQEEYKEAAGDFQVCVVLWPEFAWGHFNLGCALYKSGQKAEAIEAYTAALERDPDFVLTYWNRGLAYQELQQYAQALADFDKSGRDDAYLHAYRAVALEKLNWPQEATAAFQTAQQRALSASEDVRSGIRWCYAFALAARDPKEARELFKEVLRVKNPWHAQALFGCAMLAEAEGKPEEALRFFTLALATDPNFLDARCDRAILYARQGNIPAASADIDWCLERAKSGLVFYKAACVFVLAAAKDPKRADKLTAEALVLLRDAFVRGYGRDHAAADPDLEGIRRHPEFQRLLKK